MWTDDFLDLLKQSTLGQSRFEEAIALKQQHLPARIYKYRTDNSYARENLASDTVWLASPASYNDPYDCFLRFSAPSMVSAFERNLIDAFVAGYKVEIAPEEVAAAKESAQPLEALSHIISSIGKPGNSAISFLLHMVPNYIETAVEFLQIVRSVAKLCSFSRVGDSILMWSHYANQHRGFCVEYEVASFDAGDAFLKNLYPVIYSEELFDLTPWAEKLVSGQREELTTVFPLLGVLQKFDGWSYEREWRYVRFQEKPTPDCNRSMPRPTRVLLGAKALPETINDLTEICKAKQIPLWQMRMADDKYELVAHRIGDPEQ